MSGGIEFIIVIEEFTRIEQSIAVNIIWALYLSTQRVLIQP
jgi:hypothetical protein